MPVIFNDHHKHTTLYRNPLSSGDLHVKGLTESSDIIAFGTGTMTFRNWCLDGYRLAYSVLKQEEQTVYDIRNDIDAVKIYFNRQGDTSIDYHQLSKRCSVRGRQYNVIYSGELDTRMSHTG